MARIALEGVAHSYDAWPQNASDYAVRRLDHVWEDGGAHALLGPPGCGKTTLLDVISGLIHPTNGRVTFDESDVTDLPIERRNIAQVFQFPVVYEAMTVFDNLAFPLRNRGVDRAETEIRVRRVAEMLELGNDLHRRAQALSADARQRTSLGRALVRADVAAILLDEPFRAVDPKRKRRLGHAIRQTCAARGVSVIYATREPGEALGFADRVAVMHQGKVLQAGAPHELFERPGHAFVGEFVGSPGMNLMPCRIDGDSAVVERLRIPLAAGLAERARRTNKTLELGIRPEFLRFSASMVGGAVQVNIAGVEDLGSFKIVTARLGALRLKVKLPEDEPVPGRQGWLIFPPERTRIFADGHLVS